MKDLDLGKDYVIPSPSYRGITCWSEERQLKSRYQPSKEQKHRPCQDALDTAARVEGLPLDVSMQSHLKMLGEESQKSKYHQSLSQLKPFRTTTKHEHPVDNAGLFSLMTFSWLTPLAYKAYRKGELFFEDIWMLSKLESSECNSRRLMRLWQTELQDHGSEGASLRRVVWKFCHTRLLISIVCLMVTQLAGFSGPVSGLTDHLCQEELLSEFLSRVRSESLPLFFFPGVKVHPVQSV
ncbi:multidrug resistance-associated protein 5 isoform X3 [Polypterus senegalus]|uniref:multidrug resistance-associated protein 5 isoform X3 n=1 Tax=Polypterus senegalus TaxID=55291 RepID=UPI00196627AB|nr:multidrug resistance-associated protein 5 isoform X3 [Polypterus senegalus]